MRWWFRKKPSAPAIPAYQPIEFKHLEPKDPAYVVTEKEMSETGMFRLFPWKKPKG